MEQPERDILSLGKVLPNARDLEQSVLGALLIESKAFIEVESILSVSDFYDERHQIIYKGISNLSQKRKPVDMVMILEELRQMGELTNIGGATYIAELTDKVSSAAHIVFHSQIIVQKAISRRIIEAATRLIEKGYDETTDVDDLIEQFEQSITDIQSEKLNVQSVDMQRAVNMAIDEASDLQTSKQSGRKSVIPTHLEGLDKALNGGFRSPDLIILGARPSMGKTQQALQMAKAAAESGHNVGFFSIEMTNIQLINRYLLEDDRIKTENLLSGQMNNFEWKAVDEQAAKIYNLPISFADDYRIKYLSNIKTEARRLKRLDKLDILFIDYLGLIKTNMKFERRQIELGHITGELKSLAKELKIPIVVLSQLSRPEKGGKIREPRLDDLRESGDIEQDADIVLFPHKPDYYDSSLTEWKNKGVIIIGKYRNGARNNLVYFGHDDRYKKVFDINENIELPF